MLMRSSLFISVVLATTAEAEGYNPSYAQLLPDTGLLTEAYQYSLIWSGQGDEQAPMATPSPKT